MSLVQSSITSNIARGDGVQGGGIFAVGDVTLDASTVSSNTVNGYGGGIFGSYNVTLTNSTVAGNSASRVGIGGGIFAGGVASPLPTAR